MPDDAVVLLCRAGQERRHVDQRDQRNVKAVAETDESGDLVGRMIVQRTAHGVGLVGHDAHHSAFHPAKAHHRIGGKFFLYLEKAGLIHDTVYHFLDVIGMAGIVRDDIPDLGRLRFHGGSHPAIFHFAKYLAHLRQDALPLHIVDHRRFLRPVARQIGKQLAHAHQAFILRVVGKMGYAAFLRVYLCAAQLLHRHLLIDDRLHHVRARDKHLGDIFYHKNKITDGRRIAGAAGAWPENDRDLRDHAGCFRMPQEHAAVAAERRNPLFNTGAAAVVDTDQGRLHLHRHILDPADLKGMVFAQRTADHREILTGHKHLPAVNLAVSGHHAVSRHSPFIQIKVVDPRLQKSVHFHKSSRIEQHFNPLPRRHLAYGMLLVDSVLTTAQERPRSPAIQFFNSLVPVHNASCCFFTHDMVYFFSLLFHLTIQYFDNQTIFLYYRQSIVPCQYSARKNFDHNIMMLTSWPPLRQAPPRSPCPYHNSGTVPAARRIQYAACRTPAPDIS